jgi:outer membrane protein assembly factor BamA
MPSLFKLIKKPIAVKNELKKLLIFAVGFLITVNIYANPDSLSYSTQKYCVDSIKISGNETTEDFIILRELTFVQGDSVTNDQLKFNRERIFSLRLFTKVDLFPSQTNNSTVINIVVNEGWYLYPIPFLKKAERNSNNYSYGINFTYKNFRGRNEYLRASVNFGYDPYFSLVYSNPALVYKEDLGLSFSTSFVNMNNKSVTARNVYNQDFKTKFYSIGLSVDKRLNQFNQLFVMSSFDYIESPQDIIGNMSASGKPIDRVLSIGGGYAYDSRDLKLFSTNGIYSSIFIKHKGFGINNINYNVLSFDFREYRRLIDKLSSRWKIAFRHTFGAQVPLYDYSFLGYDEYVRGHSKLVLDGNNYLLSSIEIHYPLIREFDFSIKLPLIPQKLTSARLGLFFTAFADAGNTFNNKQKLSFKEFYYGYGFGFAILILPYNVIRFEYAINKYGAGEILIGSGFSF